MKTFFRVFCFLSGAALSQAGVVGYLSNPTGDSTDFALGVAAAGRTVNTIDFETHPLGPLQPNFYSGVHFAFSPVTASVTSGYDATVGASTLPKSPGEGLHDGSHHIFPAGSALNFKITFDNPVLAAGFFLIDYFNPSGVNQATLEAFTGPNGTGGSLGSFNTAGFNFELNNTYFIGILSTNSDIRSIVFTTPGAGNDSIGIDNVKFAAAAPEPATWMFCLAPLLLGLRRARLAKH